MSIWKKIALAIVALIVAGGVISAITESRADRLSADLIATEARAPAPTTAEAPVSTTTTTVAPPPTTTTVAPPTTTTLPPAPGDPMYDPIDDDGPGVQVGFGIYFNDALRELGMWDRVMPFESLGWFHDASASVYAMWNTDVKTCEDHAALSKLMATDAVVDSDLAFLSIWIVEIIHYFGTADDVELLDDCLNSDSTA